MTLSCRRCVSLAIDDIGCRAVIAIISIRACTIYTQSLVGAFFFALGSGPSASAHKKVHAPAAFLGHQTISLTTSLLGYAVIRQSSNSSPLGTVFCAATFI